MKHYFLFLIAWLSLSLSVAHAQLAFTGRVTDAAGKPLEFATAALYDTDSAFFKGSVTDATGTFQLDRVSPGRYTLEVRLIGFQTVRKPVDLRASEPDLGTITLTETGVGLSEVTVTAAAPAVLQKADRMIVRPEVYMLTAGKNAADVLRQLPGVIVDANGGISIVGKPAIVYINGKPADLTGTTVEQLLKTMQAERIERVELITNPSARYEAAHSGAIIDIRLRRDESMGFNGTASASYYLKTTGPAVEPSLSANYRSGRWNVYGSYGGNMGRYEHQYHNVNRYHTLDVPLEYTDHGVFRPSGTLHNGSFGVDWYASDSHTFGFLARGVRYDGGNTNRTTTDIRRLGRTEVDSAIHAPLTMDIYNNNLSLDLNHVWTPTKQTRLSTDVIYAYADHNQEQQMVLHYAAPDGRELRPREGNGHSVFQKTNVWLVKTDLEAPLPAGVRLETGAQLSGIRRDNNLRGLTLATADAWIDNPGQSNHFIYKEQIAGLYLNLSRAWGERFSCSAGLRAEHTLQDGYQEVGDTGFTRRRWELFPSASVHRPRAVALPLLCAQGGSAVVQQPEPLPVLRIANVLPRGQPQPAAELSSQPANGLSPPQLQPHALLHPHRRHDHSGAFAGRCDAHAALYLYELRPSGQRHALAEHPHHRRLPLDDECQRQRAIQKLSVAFYGQRLPQNSPPRLRRLQQPLRLGPRMADAAERLRRHAPLVLSKALPSVRLDGTQRREVALERPRHAIGHAERPLPLGDLALRAPLRQYR